MSASSSTLRNSAVIISRAIGYEATSFPYTAELFSYVLLLKFYGLISFHLIAPPAIYAVFEAKYQFRISII